MTVVPYSAAELVRLLASTSEATPAFVNDKAHRRFLEVYLDQLGARTIVLEPYYVDKDYLHDYSSYYVSCFHNYRRITARLHFFAAAFDQDAFVALLTGAETFISAASLQSNYLGFIVVKPLPQTVIGRTCLKTYPTENGRRNFPVVQQYSANLAGISLTVESLPFQEQDSVAAACATSALWSCFHATGRYFHHPILSPTEITNAAAVSFPDGEIPNTRTFPSRGLSARQMARAINFVGLEPQIIGATNAHLVKSTLYAYLRGKLPVLLGISLLNYDSNVGNGSSIGRHAVAVTGYESGASPIVPYGGTGFKLTASAIAKIYVHDDQLGPFARMRFAVAPGAHFGQVAGDAEIMKTEWASNIAGSEVIAVPVLMLLPLYKKIRIPFDLIHDTILELDGIIEMIRAQFFAHLDRPEWDIHLTSANDFKSGLLAEARDGHTAGGLEILTACLPRFLWRATANVGGNKYCDLLFDATGLEQSALLIYAKIDSADLRTMLTPFAAAPLGGVQTRHLLMALGTATSSAAMIFSP